MTCRTYTFIRLRSVWRWLTWLGPLGDFRERRATRDITEDEMEDLIRSGAVVVRGVCSICRHFCVSLPYATPADPPFFPAAGGRHCQTCESWLNGEVQ